MLSAFSRIAQVLRTITRASRGVLGRRHAVGHQQPADPLGIVLVHLAPEGADQVASARHHRQATYRVYLAYSVARDLPDHRDPDLTRVLQLLLHLLRDVARDHLRGEVVDVLRLDQDPDLAARLHRVDLLDAREGVADLLQAFQPLDVGLERLAAGARAGRR